MDDPRTGKRRSNGLGESLPRDAAALTAPIEPLEQKPARDIQIPLHTAEVATDSKVLDMALEVAAAVVEHSYGPVRAQHRELRTEFLQLLP